MSSLIPQSDLPLAALRYLAGELNAADTDAFERLLATDDAAQQALVHAVQISAALQSGTITPSAVPSSRVARSRQPQRTSRWSSAAALVGSGLVAATVLVALREEPSSSMSVVSSETANAGATVSLWRELNVEEIETSPIDESMLVMLDGEASDAVQVPDWMFAAVETDFAAADDHPTESAAPKAADATDEDS